MVKIGDTVLFWFVHSAACLDDCPAPGDEPCDCVAKRFVSRPAKVLGMTVDDGASAHIAIARIDVALAKSDDELVADVDPTDENAETAKQRRTRYAAAREQFVARADQLAKTPLVELDIDVEFLEQDMADLGLNVGLDEYRKRGLAVHSATSQATTNPPIDLHESGTWTEAA